MEHRRVARPALACLALLALCGLYAAILSGRVGAQDDAPPERVEAIARICVAEAGWSTDTGDCAAITHLLVRRAERRGVRPITMARAYSTRHFDRRRTDARRWIADLTLDAHEPAGWPSRIPWARFRDRWLATVEHVRQVLRGHVADPCPGSDHWGGPMDDERARRAGLVRVECSAETRNRFWRVPRRRS